MRSSMDDHWTNLTSLHPVSPPSMGAARMFCDMSCDVMKLTFCRPSRTVCRFLFRISSLDSYFILRSGTTAIRLKRMSWYGSLGGKKRKSRAAAWEWSPEGESRRWAWATLMTHPAVASPILSMITRRALSVHSSSSPQGPESSDFKSWVFRSCSM